jgi:oxaloacetate decarboxylase gamma subunit
MEMLGQSGVLTILGMGVVFSFLFILIIVISVAGKIISALKLNKDLIVQSIAVPASSAVSGNAITAAISAAVSEYRKSKK